MKGIVVNPSDWHRIVTCAKAKEEKGNFISKKELLQVKKTNEHRQNGTKNILQGLETVGTKKRRRGQEKRTEENHPECFVVQQGQKDKLKNFTLDKKCVTSGPEEADARRKILSAAALAAILYERDNQVKFNKEHNLKDKNKGELLSSELPWPQRIIPYNHDFSKLKAKQDLDLQLKEIQELKERKEAEKTLEKQIMEKETRKFQQHLAEERENKRLLKLHRRNDIQNYLSQRWAIKQAEKKHQIEQEQLRQIYAKVGDQIRLKINAQMKQIPVKLRLKMETVRTSPNLNQKFKITSPEALEIPRLQPTPVADTTHPLNVHRNSTNPETHVRTDQTSVTDPVPNSAEVIRKRHQCDVKWTQAQVQRLYQARRKILEQNLRLQREKEEQKKLQKSQQKVSIPADDSHLLRFCDWVLGEAEAAQRPLFPIIEAIRQVKQDHGIIKKKKKIAHLLSNLPVS